MEMFRNQIHCSLNPSRNLSVKMICSREQRVFTQARRIKSLYLTKKICMYEVDFTGWTRTPEDIKRLKEDKWFRFKRNWTLFYKSILMKRFQWFYLWNLIFNK